jgi:hypothetical protein
MLYASFYERMLNGRLGAEAEGARLVVPVVAPVEWDKTSRSTGPISHFLLKSVWHSQNISSLPKCKIRVERTRSCNVHPLFASGASLMTEDQSQGHGRIQTFPGILWFGARGSVTAGTGLL